MKDACCLIGLIVLSLGIIFGTAAVQQSNPTGWIIPVVLIFIGSLLLTRVQRDNSNRNN